MDQNQADNMSAVPVENNLVLVTLSGSALANNLGLQVPEKDVASIEPFDSESDLDYPQFDPTAVTRTSVTSNTTMAVDDLPYTDIEFIFATETGDVLINGGTINEAMDPWGTKYYLSNFTENNTLSFYVSSEYGDQTKYRTSYDRSTGLLSIDYVNDDGSITNIVSFGYLDANENYVDPENAYIPKVVVTDAGDGTYMVTLTKCFLAGTHILTPDGEIVVENLRIGDTVTTVYEGQKVAKPIIWVGSKEVNVNHYKDKESLYPIRIKIHAFGINQPCRDLLITPEHTIYVNNKLTPARMLVNDRSIIVDRSIDRFTVFHIETEQHSILLSENLTTESYLNTDDRHQFNQKNTVHLNLAFEEHSGHKNWQDHAVAPLEVRRDQVEPIWQELNNRATKQGYMSAPKPKTTRDPALRLVTRNGKYLYPIDVSGKIYSFYLPTNTCVVAIHSKSALPSQAIGPFVDDRRKLGVLVSKISVCGTKTVTVVPADMPELSGWYPADIDRDDRWTKGFAVLPPEVVTTYQTARVIKVELTDTAEYFVDNYDFVEQTA